MALHFTKFGIAQRFAADDLMQLEVQARALFFATPQGTTGRHGNRGRFNFGEAHRKMHRVLQKGI